MPQGLLQGIFITAKHGEAMTEVGQIEMIAGRGLVGDRFLLPEGKSKPASEITLIEEESLQALQAEHAITLSPGETRRNLLTRGIPLNDLVGKEFTVGKVRLRGIELCHPCGHLEKLTRPGVKQGLNNRGGLRAAILASGTLQVGAAIDPLQ